MFIIFGTRGIAMKSMSGHFHCAYCGSNVPFHQKNVRRFFTLFFIPLIPLDTITSYVECQRCRGQFDVNVLNQDLGPDPIKNPVHIAGFRNPPKMLAQFNNHKSYAEITSKPNRMATASLILGIISVITAVVACPAIITTPLALIFGVLGLVNSRNQFGIVIGRGKSIAGLSCAVVAIAIMAFMIYIAKNSHTAQPEADKLETIKAQLTQSADSTSYGNTPLAKELAAKMVLRMRVIEVLIFGKGSVNYVVHCEQHAKKWAFLIYVPNYHMFDQQDLETISKTAWLAAIGMIDGVNTPRDTELCLALKGEGHFGAISTGTIVEMTPSQISTNENNIGRFLSEEKKLTPAEQLEEIPANNTETP